MCIENKFDGFIPFTTTLRLVCLSMSKLHSKLTLQCGIHSISGCHYEIARFLKQHSHQYITADMLH